MNNFKLEMQEYLKHGKMVFSFDNVVLPVVYREALNVLAVKMPAKEVFVPVNKNMGFHENMDVLLTKLLEQYSELEK